MFSRTPLVIPCHRSRHVLSVPSCRAVAAAGAGLAGRGQPRGVAGAWRGVHATQRNQRHADVRWRNAVLHARGPGIGRYGDPVGTVAGRGLSGCAGGVVFRGVEGLRAACVARWQAPVLRFQSSGHSRWRGIARHAREGEFRRGQSLVRGAAGRGLGRAGAHRGRNRARADGLQPGGGGKRQPVFLGPPRGCRRGLPDLRRHARGRGVVGAEDGRAGQGCAGQPHGSGHRPARALHPVCR